MRSKHTHRARAAATTLAILSATLLSTPTAQAAPITWTLQNVTFQDGGTASGSFVYDRRTDTYGAINIVTTAGSLMPTSTYTFFSGGSYYFSGFFDAAGGPTGASYLQFAYATELRNSGGTVMIALTNSSFEATCGQPPCRGNPSSPSRFVTSGSVSSVSSVVPEPTSGLLIAAGAAVLYAARLRRNR